MVHDGLPARAPDLVDRLVPVEGVVIEMRRGDLLEDGAGLGPELVPDPLLDQLRVARIQDASPAFHFDVQDAVQDLECLFLALVVVRRMPLPRKLDDQFLAIAPIDALDDRGPDLGELRDAVVVRELRPEVSVERDP